MLYLFLSILGSVLVGVLFKYSKGLSTNIFLMVLLNYIITTSLSYFIFHVDLTAIPGDLPVITIGLLALLMPSLFLAQYYSVLYAGIIRTDIAQRMSLFIPIVAAVFLFKEQISPIRYLALGIGLISVYLILNRSYLPKSQNTTLNNNSIYFPVIVFIGFGLIDILFKQLALYSTIPYTSSLFYVFASAFILGLLYFVILLIFGKKQILQINKQTILFGIALGVLNFINIVFYMKAHQVFSSNPTTVFAGMNFGVIILGTLIGYFLFKEKLSKINLIGVLFSILAIAILLLLS
ncbi:EamA/RhaT family transporter [Myroides sp. LJL119]